MGAAVDVAVIGAGPAGCAAALALRRAGVDSVVLVAAARGARPRFGESLPPDCRLPLSDLGLWPAFQAQRPEPCVGSASSWGGDALGCNDFLFNPHGSGWHIERRQFDAFLLEQALAAGVALRPGTAFEGAANSGGGIAIRLRAGAGAAGTIEARFAVDASGQRARLARALGAVPQVNDRLICVAALVKLDQEQPLGQMTLLEAVEYGWWYAARVGPEEAIVVLASDAELVRERRLHEAASWRTHLAGTRHLATALGAADRATGAPPALAVRRALSVRLDRCAGPNWLAVGDAASAYDPISSQGVHKALVEGLAGARRIAQWLREPDGAELAGHQAWMDARFAGYLRLRDYLYGQEIRWADAPFWQRRRQATAAGLGATTTLRSPAHD